LALFANWEKSPSGWITRPARQGESGGSRNTPPSTEGGRKPGWGKKILLNKRKIQKDGERRKEIV